MQYPRLALTLPIVAALALTVYFIADYSSYKQDRDQRSIELGKQAGVRVAQALDAQLSAISRRAQTFATQVSTIDTETRLLESITAESLQLPLLLGVTVAFEPGRFLNKDRYAPFFNKSRNEFQFVEDTYDYTSQALETAKWYTRVVETRQSMWSDPYYAEAAEAMVVDYGVPLFSPEGELVGMVDYTISLSDFTRIVDSLSIGESGYGFTYDSGGAILSHPDSSYLLESVFQLRDGKDEAILNTMRNDPEGVVEYNSTYTYKFSWFFFRTLESTGWKSVLVFAEDDLLGASDQGRKKVIHIAIGVGVLLITILLFAFRIDQYNPQKLWWMVITISLVIVGNIIVIWYLNLTTDFSLLETDQERIVNKSILTKYVESYDNDLHKLAQTNYHKVPTGIFIESYELTSFEASLIGRLWMKYPKSLYDIAPPAFYFPDISAIEPRGMASELISEVEGDDHVLVTWRFRATLEQNFSYQQFPFEQNDIQVVLQYPDFSKHIMLIPDLESYDILNPIGQTRTERGDHGPLIGNDLVLFHVQNDVVQDKLRQCNGCQQLSRVDLQPGRQTNLLEPIHRKHHSDSDRSAHHVHCSLRLLEKRGPVRPDHNQRHPELGGAAVHSAARPRQRTKPHRDAGDCVHRAVLLFHVRADDPAIHCVGHAVSRVSVENLRIPRQPDPEAAVLARAAGDLVRGHAPAVLLTSRRPIIGGGSRE